MLLEDVSTRWQEETATIAGDPAMDEEDEYYLYQEQLVDACIDAIDDEELEDRAVVGLTDFADSDGEDLRVRARRDWQERSRCYAEARERLATLRDRQQSLLARERSDRVVWALLGAVTTVVLGLACGLWLYPHSLSLADRRSPSANPATTADIATLSLARATQAAMNFVPDNPNAPARLNQRVSIYRVSDVFLPCRREDGSDCRAVHPVTGARNVPHRGVDVAMPYGSQIFALGKVGAQVRVTCRYDWGGGGLVATLRSDSLPEWEFRALHLSDCTSGTFLAGTAIAAVGASGGVTGPHLHWEAIRNGQYVDPPLWTLHFAIAGNLVEDRSQKYHY